jgi:metallo-beta-lactamase family protein
MEIQFHGAVRTVTGSQHLLKVNGRQILLDCGLYQGKRQESYERNLHLPFNAGAVDALILSHAHIDHSGNVPNLVKSGFKGDIVCTYATRDLCALMLHDSAKIQQYDVEYLNKKLPKGERPLQPLYSADDVTRSLNQFIGIGYERPYQLLPGIRVTFYDAGHILGSAIVALDVADEATGQDVRLVFSGDLGRYNRPILRDPSPLTAADILLIESTYGDRRHEPQEELAQKLADVVNETYRRGGKLIVPAFALGRTQELVYRLHQLVVAGAIPADLRVYVDSPLAVDATGIYRLHPEAYDEGVAEFLLEARTRDPFGFDMIRYTRTTSESKELNALRRPAIIISASGMAEAGRILHHLKNNVEDARNTILIIGWQAQDTLGRRIVEKQPQLNILGGRYQLRARVATINGFSAHADQSELLTWVEHLQRPPQHTFIVHGELNPGLALARQLMDRDFTNVHVPEMAQSFPLTVAPLSA